MHASQSMVKSNSEKMGNKQILYYCKSNSGKICNKQIHYYFVIISIVEMGNQSDMQSIHMEASQSRDIYETLAMGNK